ncbi:hypothetical protein H2509_06015 [Stappia sp. F7233]|uniref:Uncharacterized protein n=1 Tax=Stappia albiluteola TaxID=2758565 RepID=A0A839AAJ4_9HYPH|nr:hypothetical protein [Stappia albiluteola]MBA5776680.1 hypothetical protein [Stappia albiluteola]
MGKRHEQAPADPAQLVADYKTVLQRVLDRRPSGTRQRIASTLGKNRSFVTQICNPGYPTPIPAAHLEQIMEICHFSAVERQQFLTAYDAAHPGRLPLHEKKTRLRVHTVYLPDLGDEAKNRKLDALVGDFLQRLGDILDDEAGQD